MNREITAKELSLRAIKKAQGDNQGDNQLENSQTLSPVRRAGEISNMSTESANLFQPKQGDIMATATRTSSNTKWVLAVLIIMVGIANQGFWVWHDRSKETYNNTPAGLEEIAVRKIEANTNLAKITNPSRKGDGNSFLSGAGGKSVNKAVPMFDCSTLEKRDSGFASEAIQTLGNSDAIYRLNPGCARIVMTEKMADSLGSLQASGQYIFRQKDSGSEDRYTGCGTIDGRNDSPSSCLSYLKIRVGQVLEVINVNQDVILK